MNVIAALLIASSPAIGAAPARAEAGKVLRSASCDRCHDSAISTENPGALAVYDLREQNWPERMPDARLPKLLTRLRSAPAADRELVRRFIDAELRSRRGKLPASPAQRPGLQQSAQPSAQAVRISRTASENSPLLWNAIARRR
jgi:hypothetical protein